MAHLRRAGSQYLLPPAGPIVDTCVLKDVSANDEDRNVHYNWGRSTPLSSTWTTIGYEHKRSINQPLPRTHWNPSLLNMRVLLLEFIRQSSLTLYRWMRDEGKVPHLKETTGKPGSYLSGPSTPPLNCSAAWAVWPMKPLGASKRRCMLLMTFRKESI